MRPHSVITISRAFGSGGADVGRILAARLRYRYADRVVLALAARRLGLKEVELSEREERVRSFWDDVRDVFSVGPVERYTPSPLTAVSDREIFDQERRIMTVLAERHDCVIIGRGSRWVLRDHPRALHVLLHASMRYRTERVMRGLDIRAEEDARRIIEEQDRARNEFRRRMTGEERLLATNYHLCIDTDGLDLERVADLIIAYKGARPGLAGAPALDQPAAL